MLTVLWQTKTTVSFLLEDQYVENEHHVIRKAMTPHRRKCPHVVHFNVPRDWFETNSRHQKRNSEGDKKICGCRGLLGRVIHEICLALQPFITVRFLQNSAYDTNHFDCGDLFHQEILHLHVHKDFK